MKRYIKSDNTLGITVYDDGYAEDIYCMTRLYPKRTNLPVIIWVDECGILRNVSHKFTPRAKIIIDDQEISVTIEKQPKIIRGHENIKKSDLKKVEKGLEYIGRNYDLFLKIYNDIDGSYDIDNFLSDLRKRGEYK